MDLTDRERLQPPDPLLVLLGLTVLSWVVVLAAGKAVLQLCGWW